MSTDTGTELSRREFLNRVGKVTRGIALAGLAGLAIKEGLELVKDLDPERTYNKYLELIPQEDGDIKPVVIPNPRPIRVIITPLQNTTTDTIPLRDKPDTMSAYEKNVDYKKLHCKWAIPVTGANYVGVHINENSKGFSSGDKKVIIDGKEESVGVWFIPSDEFGHPINPITPNSTLKSGEKPFYIAGNFVSSSK